MSEDVDSVLDDMYVWLECLYLVEFCDDCVYM